MNMAVSIEEIMKNFSPKRKKRIRERAKKCLEEYESLQTIRKDLGVTQTEVAEKLDIKQNNISDLEKRTDTKLSTLRDYLNALGGELIVSAKFPGQPPRIIESLSDGVSA
jgi:predicted transcriptional regulator